MILYINKPKNRTSFDVIKKLKTKFPKKTKIGHSWTLDPMATGMLLVATWSDTKRLTDYVWLDKTYETIIDFSKKTDTRDMQHRRRHTSWKVLWDNIVFSPGDIIDERPWDPWKPEKYGFVSKEIVVSAPSLEQIDTYIQSLVGMHDIPLTPFSAKKVDGKKLYEYAREWRPIFKNIPMHIIWYEILEYKFPRIYIRLHVWSGTYVRSVWHQIGEHFGLWWVLTQLKRTAIAEFTDMIEIEEVDPK